MIRKLMLPILVSVVAFPAVADVLYDNGDPDGTSTYLSGAGGLYQLDNFILAPGDNVIRSIRWYGAYSWFNPGLGIYGDDAWASDSFTIEIIDETFSGRFFQFSGSVARVATGTTTEDWYGQTAEVWEYTLHVGSLELDAGTTYYLGIANPTSNSNTAWGWATSGLGSHWQWWNGQPSGGGGELAFRLNGPPIPEPASIGLLGVGLVGLVWRFRKRSV